MIPEADHHHAGTPCNGVRCWLDPNTDGIVWDNGTPVASCTPVAACRAERCSCRRRFAARLVRDPRASHPTTDRYL